MILLQVDLPPLCAGVVAKGDRIVRTAPTLAWSRGQSPQALAAWVLARGGTIRVVERFR